MNLQKYLPYEDYTLTTKLSTSEVFKRLSNNIDHKKSAFPFWNKTSNAKPYYGQFFENTFEISRVISYRNSFLPVIKGEISPHIGGTKVVIKMSPTIGVILFMCIWMGVVGLACLFILLTGLVQFKKSLVKVFHLRF